MTLTTTTAASKTVTIKKVKAKHFANQAGLDRLQELLVKATSNPNAGQNYALTIKRAFKSLQDCKEPILTQKDAVKLKYIGPAMAKKICPQSTGVEVANKPTRWKPANKDCVDDYEYENESDHPGTSVPAAGGAGLHHKNPRPPTGLPLVCPRPAIPSVSRCTSALESFSATAGTAATVKEAAYVAAKADAENLVLPRRGPWKVILLVDNREHKSKQVVSSCKQAGIPCEERQLVIGDMAWIARCIVPNDALALASSAVASKKRKKKDEDKYRTIEILVGTIVERKEVNDLASSLFGTRYAEQRLRLSQCGLPQVLFLVEGNLSSVDNCPAETMQMAMMETRINLGFQIVQTKHLTETVSVLKTLHSRIVQRTFPDAFGNPSTNHHYGIVTSQALPTFGGGNKRRGGRGNRRASSLLELAFDTAPIPPFGSKRFITYPELKAKVEVDRERGTRSVRAITLAMLKQIPTLSQKKCTAIANHYPTMNRLMQALAYPDPRNHTGNFFDRKQHPKKAVQDIEIDTGRRTIGPNSASEIYVACCTLGDGSTVHCHAQDTKLAATETRITSFFSSAAGSFDADVDDGNRKPPPTAAATNTARPAAATRREQSPPKKARKEYASASASVTAATNVLLQFLEESSDDSSPDKPPRAFATRKRPAPIAANAMRGFASPEAPTGGRNIQTSVDNRNPLHFDAGCPSRSQQQEQQETVDLLTPEPSSKYKTTFAKSIGKTDLSDWSDCSNDACDLKRNGSNNNGLSSNVLSNTGIVSNFRLKSNVDAAISTTATATIDTAPKATKMRAPAASDGEETLFVSPDEDDIPLPTTIATKNILANRNVATTAICKATKQRALTASEGEETLLLSSDEEDVTRPTTGASTNVLAKRTTVATAICPAIKQSAPAASDGAVTLLLSSDEDDSPLPINIATKHTLTNRDSDACAKGTSKPASARLESSSQATPNDSKIGSKPTRLRSSLASSPGDGSILFSSPDDTLYPPCEAKPPGRTNNSDKDSGIGIVCLLDDSESDDDECDDVGEGIPHKASQKPSSAAALQGFGARMAFVTTTRGGALPSTQESACSDDGGSTSSEEELEVGTSLRERLGTIRGQDLREVIELDTDSE